MIPKIIHYCWLSGDSFPEKIQYCIDTWKKILPDYEIILWDLNRFPLTQSDWVKEAYESKKYAFAADYIRCYALYNFGGIYLDSDVEVLKSFNDLLDLPYFMCFEKSSGEIEAATIAAEPHFEPFRMMLDYYDNRHFILDDNKYDMITIPVIFRKMLEKHYTIKSIQSKSEFIYNGNVVCVFPKYYFSPIDYENNINVCSDETYSVHHYAGSWVVNHTAPLRKIRHSLKKKLEKIAGKKRASILSDIITLRVLKKKYSEDIVYSMKVLINASNLGPGGATQVTDSLCCSLDQFPDIHFVVVLQPSMQNIAEKIKGFSNVKIVTYQLHNSWRTYIFARDKFLDNLMKQENIDVVFSVFAPTWWTPRKPHLCGFALAHLVMPESPYFTSQPYIKRMKLKLHNAIMTFFYWRCSSNYYTENELISKRVKKLLHCKNVFTVTNYYNQVFDQPEKQHYRQLPPFEGTTLLILSNSYPHKNLPITIDITKILQEKHPEFNFRFVFTITENQFLSIPEELQCHFLFIGKVDITECPSLYEQCDISFQPTLLECFTATYPEAMRMGKPIVTTDLEFARELCGNSAVYYEPLSAQSAADAIYKVATNKDCADNLMTKGREELMKFDSYVDRAAKLISYCQLIIK